MKIFILYLLICFNSFMAFAQQELTDDNAESHLLNNNDRLIVLDFYATWCAPCKEMAPIIADLEREYGDKVDFYKIDVDKNVVDDALGVQAMPTYLFIKNSKNLEQFEGAVSKSKMKEYIEKHIGSTTTVVVDSQYYSALENHGDSGEFSDATIAEIDNSSTSLNSLAWHAYEEHNDINDLLKAIRVVEKSIELDKNYYNVDTHAALLYKTGNYTKALKKAKEAILVAKANGENYSATSELIEKIIDRL